MKVFDFAGGSVELMLPDDWTQETEEDEVGVLYSAAEDAGVLRMRARTFHNPQHTVTPDAVSELILGMATRLVPDTAHEVETLADVSRMVTYLQTFPDDAPPIVVASWLVGIAIPPHHVQVVSYTYTVPGQFAATAATVEELELVEEAIRGAEYQVSGLRF
jgi:hypothetical protein